MTGQKTKNAPQFLMTVEERLELLLPFVEAGVMPALYEALVLVRDGGCQLPDCIIDGAIMIVGDRLKFGFTTGKGATGNELAKYQAAMRRFRRWQAVKKLRGNGIPWTEVYFEAEEMLSDTFAEAKAETIKKSYQRVEKDMKDPVEALQYFHAYSKVRELTDTPVLNLG